MNGNGAEREKGGPKGESTERKETIERKGKSE